MTLPFTEKYRPKTTADIQGHPGAVAQVRTFVEKYASQKKKGILLYGAPGCGKTSLVHALANELGLELVEVNASDVRNKDAIQTLVGSAMKQMSLFGGGKIILFDEMDGLSGTKDRGGIQTLTELLKESAFPVILTANNPWDSKFSTLRKYVELVELKTLSYTTVFSVLKNVCEKEGIMYEEEALKQLARRAGGDLRGALTDAQTLGEDKLIDNADIDDLSSRRQAETMFTALQRVLKGRDALLAKQAVDMVDEDLDSFFSWVDENVPLEYKKPEDLIAAFDALSRADVMRGRIRRWQHWRFLVYQIDWMTAGVSLAKRERYTGFTKFSRGQRGLSYWRAGQANAKRDAIAGKIAEKTHTSVKVARQSIMPYVAKILAKNNEHELVDAYELANEEVQWLAKQA